MNDIIRHSGGRPEAKIFSAVNVVPNMIRLI